MKRNLILLLLFLVLFSCKKEEPDWEWCHDCAKEALIGTYTGKATNNSYQGEDLPWAKTENLDVTINISESNNNLFVSVSIPNVSNRNFTIDYTGSYYLNYLLNFNATIWKRDDQIKLVGTVKNANEIMVYQIIDFEVYLNENLK